MWISGGYFPRGTAKRVDRSIVEIASGDRPPNWICELLLGWTYATVEVTRSLVTVPPAHLTRKHLVTTSGGIFSSKTDRYLGA
jgi:hypothetical protein